MFFDSDFIKLYEELSMVNDIQVIEEGKKAGVKSKEQPRQIDYHAYMDNFLYSIGLVRISEIAPGCPNFSVTGAGIWVPSERAVNIKYKKDIPYFDKLAVKRLPKFVCELPEGEYPTALWEPKTIQNNDGRKMFEVDLGSIGSTQWRGICFRFKIHDISYFVFGKVFYKGYQKVNASTNRDVAAANVFYDAIMQELKKNNVK